MSSKRSVTPWPASTSLSSSLSSTRFANLLMSDHQLQHLAPFPVVRTPPDEIRTPVVVSVPHAGTWIPEDEVPRYALDAHRLAMDGDLFVDALYEHAPSLGATVVSSPYSRFVVDLNRRADDISPRSVDGAVRRRAAGYYGDRGVIWAVTTRNESIYHAPLPREVYESRIARYHAPYHATLQRVLHETRARFGFAILLDAHSMPSRAAKLHKDAGALRPDIVPGDVHGQSCAPWLSNAIETFWRARGKTVRRNEPYAGGAISRVHGNPTVGIHAIQLELNRALYMDEQALQPHDGFAFLAQSCDALVVQLGGLRPSG